MGDELELREWLHVQDDDPIVLSVVLYLEDDEKMSVLLTFSFIKSTKLIRS